MVLKRDFYETANIRSPQGPTVRKFENNIHSIDIKGWYPGQTSRELATVTAKVGRSFATGDAY